MGPTSFFSTLSSLISVQSNPPIDYSYSVKFKNKVYVDFTINIRIPEIIFKSV
jgi:hypothetical protein